MNRCIHSNGLVDGYCIECDTQLVPRAIALRQHTGEFKTLQAVLPTDHAARNEIPMCTGFIDYFPLACAEVAKLSKAANDQHNPGEDMHWARGKSTEHRDKILKHLVDSGTLDSDGQRHSAKVAWRAMALLQEELEAEGGRPGRASRFPSTVKEI